MSETVRRFHTGEREIILVGTAHVSRDSVEEVKRIIREEAPGRVCVEIDASRFKSMTEGQKWSDLDMYQVLKTGRGFLMLANLVMSSFQRRLGLDLGVKVGEEMLAAVEVSRELDIPFSMCDRDIQVTLRRAWAKSSLWGKNKMLAALLSSVFTNEKLSPEQIEELKNKTALEGMMEELAEYLPAAKEVLIDERDRYLATRIFQTGERKVVAVVGAGHLAGILKVLQSLDEGSADTDLSGIETVPAKSTLSRLLPWIVPIAIVALFGVGLLRSGWQSSLKMFLLWVVMNGGLSALGCLIALAHPVTIISAFFAAPLAVLNPAIGIGMITGVLEAWFKKPRVRDFETLHDDITTFRGFFRNRFTHILIVFFLSSIGSMIGTFAGIPFLASLL